MPPTAPTVSVIIPAYNAGLFVRSAVESVLNQTYQDVEVLVIDDGSVDQTAAAVQSLGPCVRYMYQSNGGPSVARNTGIINSTGRLIAFLDSDDFWMPNFLEQGVTALDASPEIDGVHAWARFIDGNGVMLPDSMRPSYGEDILSRLLLGGSSAMFSMVVFRRESFDQVGLFDPGLRQAEDWDMVLRLVANGLRLLCIPQLLVGRRVHTASSGSDPERGFYWDRLALQKAFSTLPLPPQCRSLEPAAHFGVLHRAAMGHWRRGETKAAVQRLAEGFDMWPEALHRPQTYLSIISRLQPSGYRNDDEILRNLDKLADRAVHLFDEMSRFPGLSSEIRAHRREVWGILEAVLALLFYRKRCWKKALKHALRSVPNLPIHLLKYAGTRAYQTGILRRAR